MKRNILLIIGMIGFFSVNVQAQENASIRENAIENDSIPIAGGFITLSDTLAKDLSLTPLKVKGEFKPNPTRAVLYAAFFPGLGQIYNRKYWKLPLVYGAAIGCVYAVTWNGTQYRGYRNAYRDLYDKDPKTNSWQDYNYRYYGGSADQPETWNPSAVTAFGNRLKSGKDNFRRNLELSYIVSVGVHLICMVDAYVDAQLFEFDISEDLSFKVEPVLFERTLANSRSFGFQCSITF